MPLTNIVDRRDRPYRFQKINAVMEPTAHDNSIEDADKVAPGYDHIGYDERKNVPLASAVEWANSFPFPTTLFIYDEGRGIGDEADETENALGLTGSAEV